jgi:hypothetical protein
VFGGDLGRAARSQQCVGKPLAAVGFREPPRSGINQSQALHCGKVRLPLTQDRHITSFTMTTVNDHQRRLSTKADAAQLGYTGRPAR